MNDHTKISKFISLVLRHNPQVIGITLDEFGFADVSELINGISEKGYMLNQDILFEIVETDNKKRYIFNKGKTKIRANQGHSIKINLELKKQKPPNILYHGTAEKYYDSIMQNGIQKRSRTHVHLSTDFQTAIEVGRRHGKPIVFKVDSKSMYEKNYEFFLSDNGVWLTFFVSNEFLSIEI